jgi:hypothetical protein
VFMFWSHNTVDLVGAAKDRKEREELHGCGTLRMPCGDTTDDR